MLSPPPPRARAGCSLHLQCQLASSTPVTIRWWYNGLLLHEDKLPEVRLLDTIRPCDDQSPD